MSKEFENPGEHSAATEENGKTSPVVTVQRFGTGDKEVAVFGLQGELRDQLLSSLKRGHLEAGRYTPDARALSSQTMLSMLSTGSAAAGTAISAGLSSTLYMATADPSTLMQIGSGVGSAVVGSGGISAHAPFIPVAASLPVVAPLMAMQALTAAVTLQQFKQVDQKLDSIKKKLDEAIAREEATITAELLSASDIADEVYRHFQENGEFSNDMLIRLAMAERDVRRVALRARFLVDSHTIEDATDEGKIHRANYDAQSAMLATFLELRVAYLRLSVDMQENPKSVPGSVEQLQVTLEDGAALWDRLLHRSSAIKEELEKIRDKRNDMNPLVRKLNREKAIDSLEAAYTLTLESEKRISQGFDALIRDAQETLQAIKQRTTPSAQPPSLLYWQDETGDHCIYTNEIPLSITSGS